MRDPFQWSIGLGRWHDLTLRLHLFFVVFAATAAYVFWPSSLTDTAWQSEHPLLAAGNIVGIAAATISVLFLSVLVHELAHWWVARLARVEPRAIVLGPLGGLSEWPTSAGPRWDLGIWLAGPAANLLLATGLIGVMRLAHPEVPIMSLINPLEPVHVEQPASFVLSISIWLNCLLILLNLLPSYPFDGGRVLRALLQVAFPHVGERRRVEWNFWLTVGISVLMAAAALALWKHGTSSDTISRAWLALLLLAVVLLVSARRDALAQSSTTAAQVLGQAPPIEHSSVQQRRLNRQAYWTRREWEAKADEEDDGDDESMIDEVDSEELEDDRVPANPLASEMDDAQEEQRVDAVLSRLYSQGMDSLSAEDRALLQRASARYRSRLSRRDGMGRRR